MASIFKTREIDDQKIKDTLDLIKGNGKYKDDNYEVTTYLKGIEDYNEPTEDRYTFIISLYNKKTHITYSIDRTYSSPIYDYMGNIYSTSKNYVTVSISEPVESKKNYHKIFEELNRDELVTLAKSIIEKVREVKKNNDEFVARETKELEKKKKELLDNI